MREEKKKLLIYAHYYIPDVAATGQILSELAEGMLKCFDITVICVVPSYNGIVEEKYKRQKYYKEEMNGVKLLRIRVPEFSKSKKFSRIKNIVTYYFGAMKATFHTPPTDRPKSEVERWNKHNPSSPPGKWLSSHQNSRSQYF